MASHNYSPILANFPNPRSNVFLMTRFRDTEQHETISKVIASTLEEYSLNLIRADWKQYHDELWANIQLCMDASFYGIAVFEQINDEALSLNVSFELGYMLGKDKKCLLLKEKRVPRLQSDLVGHLNYKFDIDKIEETVRAAVKSWLRDLGIAKKSNEKLLVYVSHGGTCRCAMAKAITRKLLQERSIDYSLRVESMAYKHPNVAEASYGARWAIREMFGEDFLADHRTAMLTSTIEKEADLILVMAHSLLKGLPSAKTHVLKPYFGFEGDVVDPWPDDRDEAALSRYSKCALELREILEGNIDTIIDVLRPQ